MLSKAQPSPLSSRPKRSVAEGSAVSLDQQQMLSKRNPPFVIPTGA
jgi:hypothetical protein